MKKILLTFSIIALLFPIFTGIVFASWLTDLAPESSVENTYEVLAPLPGTCVEKDGKCLADVSGGGLGKYFNALYRIVVASASVLAVLMIVIGGFTYLSTDAIDNKEMGKHQIKNALGGILLILASWVILNTINPQLVNLKITSDPLRPANLADFVFINQRAQKQYEETFAEISRKVDADANKVREMREASNGMIKTLEDYQNTLRLSELQEKSNLSEEEITEKQMLSNVYGDITKEQLDELKKIVDSSGGENRLAEKATELKRLADITAVTATALTAASNHANEAINGKNRGLNSVSYENYAKANLYEYNKVLVKIDDGLKEGIITADQANQLKNQLKTETNASTDKICEAFYKRYITDEDISTRRDECRKNLIP